MRDYQFLDLASMKVIGRGASITISPSRVLPTEKRARELCVATNLLVRIDASSGFQYDAVRSNPDPNNAPDVLFHHAGAEYGIEVTEIILPQRKEKLAHLARFRSEIVHLLLGAALRPDRLIVVHLDREDRPDTRVPKRSEVKAVASAITENINRDEVRLELPVYDPRRRKVAHIVIEHTNAGDHPARLCQGGPILQVPARHVTFSDADIDDTVKSTISRKLHHSVARNTWLLAFCESEALFTLQKSISERIKTLLVERPHGYVRTFFLATYDGRGCLYDTSE